MIKISFANVLRYMRCTILQIKTKYISSNSLKFYLDKLKRTFVRSKRRRIHCHLKSQLCMEKEIVKNVSKNTTLKYNLIDKPPHFF